MIEGMIIRFILVTLFSMIFAAWLSHVMDRDPSDPLMKAIAFLCWGITVFTIVPPH